MPARVPPRAHVRFFATTTEVPGGEAALLPSLGRGDLRGVRIPARFTEGGRRHATGLPWETTAAGTLGQKLAGFDAEAFGDQFQGGKADVAFAPFDGADIGSV